MMLVVRSVTDCSLTKLSTKTASGRHKLSRIALVLMILMGLWACANIGKNTHDMAAYRLSLNAGVKDASFLTDMENELMVHLNDVRTSPERYADHLRDLKERPGWPARPEDRAQTQKEQATAGLDDTILSLQNRDPPTPFRVSKGLSLAARDLVQDHGPKGLTGHRGSDGTSPFDRTDRYGRWEGKAVEILSYGYKEAEALVAAILTDKSPTGKEDRNSLFNKDYLIAGVSCGTHKTYGTMCAIIFAQTYEENEGHPPR
jgi:uncharacterized protein YkwD